MKQQQINLDEAIRAIRDDEAPAGVAEAAANRVWTRVAREEDEDRGAEHQEQNDERRGAAGGP